MTSKPIYIVSSARSAVGSPFKGLRCFTAAQLGASVLRAAVERSRLSPDLIGEVYLGNTVSAGCGQNVARQAACLAGLSRPAYTINFVCGSGLQSVILGARSILAQDQSVVLAGGTESATYAPGLLPKFPEEGPEIASQLRDGLRCQITGKHMGELCEQLAAQNNISREDQDSFALRSHVLAQQAQHKGKFEREIVALTDPEGRVCDRDDRLSRAPDKDRLAELPPAFDNNGTITAGNASIPCDGAAAVCLAGADVIQDKKIQPQARILSYASVAVDAPDVFKSCVVAARTCLRSGGLNQDDIDLFEIGESFAAQAIYACHELSLPQDRVNVHGGDLALGHPLGAASARTLVTLLHALKDRDLSRGLACMSLGGGGGVAIAIERLD